jgi:hypothetical protein
MKKILALVFALGLAPAILPADVPRAFPRPVLYGHTSVEFRAPYRCGHMHRPWFHGEFRRHEYYR